MMNSNKVVLITGSANGIGRATAVEFAKHGYSVIIDDLEIESDAAHTLKEELESKYKVRAIVCLADVSKQDQVDAMMKTVNQEYGKIDVLVNNAGVCYDRPFADITINEFKEVLNTNIIGAFIVSRAAYPYIPKGGHICNVSSVSGIKTMSPDCLDYNITKIGLQSLTRDLAMQFSPDIRVNAVALGWVNTRMNAKLDKNYMKSEIEKSYLKYYAQPEEIAKAIYWLCSEEASFVNAAILNMDGGY